MNANTQAGVNLHGLLDNPYPGRGIIMGRNPDGNLVQIYWVMGRSESSRNRVLETIPDKHGWLRTNIAKQDGYKGDPSLLIYNAMAEERNYYVVSNGTQTDAVIANDNIDALEYDNWEYEPDNPNFTPRITGVIRYKSGNLISMRMMILRKSPFGDKCDRWGISFGEVAPGFGYFISTYQGDGNPLPSFHGEPLLMPINHTDPAEIAQMYWSALNKDNRVSLAVKIIPPDGPSKIQIINRH